MPNELGYYYLHENGDLIWKKFEPEADSPFVRRVWPVKLERTCAWCIAIEALALGADLGRVKGLAEKWGLTDEDAHVFVEQTGNVLRLFREGDQWCAVGDDFVNLQESQAGFGPTCLEALADYTKHGDLAEKVAAGNKRAW